MASKSAMKPNRNLYLVALAFGDVFKEFLEAQKGIPRGSPLFKDPKEYELGSKGIESIRQRVAPHVTSKRTLKRSEVIKALDCLAGYQMTILRPKGGYSFPKKLEDFLVNLSPYRGYLEDPRNRAHWRPLVMLATMGKRSWSGSSLASATCLPRDDLMKGVRKLERGFKVHSTGGVERFKGLVSVDPFKLSPELLPEEEDAAEVLVGIPEEEEEEAKMPTKVCLDPDKMHGAADGFPGTDAPPPLDPAYEPSDTGAVLFPDTIDQVKAAARALSQKNLPYRGPLFLGDLGDQDLEIRIPIGKRDFEAVAEYLSEGSKTLVEVLESFLATLVDKAKRNQEEKLQREIERVQLEQRAAKAEVERLNEKMRQLKAQLPA